MLTDLSLDPSALQQIPKTLQRAPWLIMLLIPLAYLLIPGGAILAVFALCRLLLKRLFCDRERALRSGVHDQDRS